MADLIDINPILEARERLRKEIGGGNDGGMPPDDHIRERVAVVENDVKHIREDISILRADMRELRSDVGTLKTDVATIKERLTHLPTTGKSFAMMAAAVSFVALLIGLAPKIQAFLGTTP